MPDIVTERSFRRRLKGKTPQLQAAIAETIKRLADDPSHPGLQAHPVHSVRGVWEAYVDGANRVTYHWADGAIVLRNHCNHDIIRRSP